MLPDHSRVWDRGRKRKYFTVRGGAHCLAVVDRYDIHQIDRYIPEDPKDRSLVTFSPGQIRCQKLCLQVMLSHSVGPIFGSSLQAIGGS